LTGATYYCAGQPAIKKNKVPPPIYTLAPAVDLMSILSRR
jgi:hypothetical protein